MLLRNLELAGRESDLVNGSRGVVVGWKSRQEKVDALQREVAKFKSPSWKMNPEEARLRSIIGKLIRSSTEFIPVVAFRNGRKIDCDPEIFDYPVFGVGECSRVQVSPILSVLFTKQCVVVHWCTLHLVSFDISSLLFSFHFPPLIFMCCQVPLKLAWALTIHKCQGKHSLNVTKISLLHSNSRLVSSATIQPSRTFFSST
jgi:hypothetical protein